MASEVSSGQHCTSLHICLSRQEGWVPLQKRRGCQPRNPPALAKLAANTRSYFSEARQHLAFGIMTSRLSMLYYASESSSILRPMNNAFMDINIHMMTDTGYFLIVNVTAMDGVCQYLPKSCFHFLWVHSQVLLLEWLDWSHPLVCLCSHFLLLLLCCFSSWVLTWPCRSSSYEAWKLLFPTSGCGHEDGWWDTRVAGPRLGQSLSGMGPLSGFNQMVSESALPLTPVTLTLSPPQLCHL